MSILNLYKELQETAPKKVVDGETVYIDEIGNVIKDESGRPVDLEELTQIKYSELNQQQQQQPEQLPPGVESQVELYSYLTKNRGLRPQSKEMNDMWNMHAKNLPFKKK